MTVTDVFSVWSAGRVDFGLNSGLVPAVVVARLCGVEYF